MAKELTWNDADDIGILLSEKYPDLDPLAVRFTDLH
ncbi:MAG: Fe-S cluster assembly protein IscX, partial [Terriglobales bacterium]